MYINITISKHSHVFAEKNGRTCMQIYVCTMGVHVCRYTSIYNGRICTMQIYMYVQWVYMYADIHVCTMGVHVQCRYTCMYNGRTCMQIYMYVQWAYMYADICMYVCTLVGTVTTYYGESPQFCTHKK